MAEVRATDAITGRFAQSLAPPRLLVPFQRVLPGKAPPPAPISGADLANALKDLGTNLTTTLSVATPSVQVPNRLFGTLVQPDGTPGAQLVVQALIPTDGAASDGTGPGATRIAGSGVSTATGDFTIPIPGNVRLPPATLLTLTVTGADPTKPVLVPLTYGQLVLGGYLGRLKLPNPVLAIPPSLFDILNQPAPGTEPPPLEPVVTPVLLGDGEDCIRVMENNTAIERFPYGLFFPLVSPKLAQETETAVQRGSTYLTAVRQESAVDRKPVIYPVSLDEFRSDLLIQPTLAATLGLGYILRASQKWSFRGLALGDLVYSLPLAPGEQQQIVITEQRQALRVQEAETVFGSQTSQASEVADSSTQATFNSAFHQAAQGGSTFSTDSVTAGGTVGGGLLSIIGLPSASVGATSSGGATRSWSDGLQTYASQAVESVHNAAAQQSSAERRASRVAMRLATAAESTSVVTKTITNHNKTRALTFEYFEVLRLYDITTSYDGVSLVLLVPFDVIWFLPPGQKEYLDDVIPDSDVQRAVDLASQIGAILSSQRANLAVAVTLGAGWPFDLTGNVASQLGVALTDAQNLASLLQAINAVASEQTQASGLVTQIGAAQAALSAYQSSKTVAAGMNAVSVTGVAAAMASALYQALLGPSLAGGMTRAQVLNRYEGLLEHQEILSYTLPRAYLSGLTRLERFASDPRASVALDSLAEDVVQISANATVMPFDHVFVSAVTRWGGRLGPVEMLPNPPTTLPGEVNPQDTFRTEGDLLDYLRQERRPPPSGTAPYPLLQATISLPRSLSPSDVVGFEVRHTVDLLTYQLASPFDILRNLFGGPAGTWTPGVVNAVFGFVHPPGSVSTLRYSPSQLNQEIGPPYLWNFQASLVASVRGGTEVLAKPSSTPVELPSGVYPIPAIEIAPVLKYSDLIAIEATLQHVLRHVVYYSRAVWSSLTPEERVMVLEPYNIVFSGGVTGTVPLLECVGTQPLGFYGNLMMLPFSMPPVLRESSATGTITGSLEDALLLFHRQAAPISTTRIALPTHGVLGEAMLGHCPSAEKIDLTRFWNWQDSPADTAPAIQPVPAAPANLGTLAGVTAPNALGGMLSTLVANVNAPTPPPSEALAQALAQQAPKQPLPDLSNAAALATLIGKTTESATAARHDALESQTQLTKEAIDKAAEVLVAYLTGKSSGKNGGSSKGDGSGASGGGSGGSDGGSSGGGAGSSGGGGG